MDIQTDPLDTERRATLSLTDTPTVLLVFAANRFTRNASRLYQQEFGIGAMDWRMLVMLTAVPDIPAARASQTIGIDKAAVSRSLARLEAKGLVTARVNGKRPYWRLTPEGEALHDKILTTTLKRQEKIFEGFSAEEINTFNDMLRRFMANLKDLDEGPGSSPEDHSA